MSTGQGIELRTIATELLAWVGQHWATDPDTAPLPDRRLILAGEPGQIAWDCEQLTVTLLGIGWGQALDASAPTSPRAGGPVSVWAMRHAVLHVELVRCQPPIDNRTNKPTDPDMQAAGLSFLRDAGLLSQALVEYASRLGGTLPREASVQPGVVEPFGPDGDFHSLRATFAVTAAELT